MTCMLLLLTCAKSTKLLQLTVLQMQGNSELKTNRGQVGDPLGTVADKVHTVRFTGDDVMWSSLSKGVHRPMCTFDALRCQLAPLA